jgi:hypothetical protein
VEGEIQRGGEAQQPQRHTLDDAADGRAAEQQKVNRRIKALRKSTEGRAMVRTLPNFPLPLTVAPPW